MATDELVATTGIAQHGASRLPSVDVDSFNIEIKDEDGFLGDRASKGAFREILDRWRKPLRKTGEDPFGKEPFGPDQQEDAGCDPDRRRHRGLGAGPQRDRGFRPAASLCHAPLPQDQGLGQDRAHHGRRRIS
ncbi:hypothetical protein BRDID11002_59690 [Bradyrhizobium diazoefficiens]